MNRWQCGRRHSWQTRCLHTTAHCLDLWIGAEQQLGLGFKRAGCKLADAAQSVELRLRVPVGKGGGEQREGVGASGDGAISHLSFRGYPGVTDTAERETPDRK